ncbi:MAG TPA: crosslink repair DNA glycosylase YcaQ family protein, partial [Polyangiaceae bacterium]
MTRAMPVASNLMAKDITKASLAQLRMQSLLLGQKRLKTVKEVAAWFGAMQSQDLASGKWSFGVRLPTSVEADIDRAIERAQVLRTWPMRGTIHFVPAEDAVWMLRTTGKKALNKAAARRAYLGLDEATVRRAAELLGKVLVGGKRLTRDQAAAYWTSKGIACEGQRTYHMLWYASQIGITCIGPNIGKEQ